MKEKRWIYFISLRTAEIPESLNKNSKTQNIKDALKISETS